MNLSMNITLKKVINNKFQVIVSQDKAKFRLSYEL